MLPLLYGICCDLKTPRKITITSGQEGSIQRGHLLKGAAWVSGVDQEADEVQGVSKSLFDCIAIIITSPQ